MFLTTVFSDAVLVILETATTQINSSIKKYFLDTKPVLILKLASLGQRDCFTVKSNEHFFPEDLGSVTSIHMIAHNHL